MTLVRPEPLEVAFKAIERGIAPVAMGTTKTTEQPNQHVQAELPNLPPLDSGYPSLRNAQGFSRQLRGLIEWPRYGGFRFLMSIAAIEQMNQSSRDATVESLRHP